MSSEPFSHAELSCRSNAATERCVFPVIVVTKQSGVARGYFPEQFVRDVQKRMMAELEEAGARPDGVYYCPHVAEDACEGRKPNPAMLKRAARELELDLKISFAAGDRPGDVELADCAGARSVLVGTGYLAEELAWHAKSWPRPPEFVAADLPEAADWISKEVQR